MASLTVSILVLAGSIEKLAELVQRRSHFTHSPAADNIEP